MEEVISLALKQAERWLFKYKKTSSESWHNFDVNIKNFIGFTNSIVLNSFFASELLSIVKSQLSDERVISILKAIDDTTNGFVDNKLITLNKSIFNEIIQELDERVKKLVAYIFYSVETIDEVYRENLKAIDRSKELQNSTQNLLNNSVKFHDPLVETIIVYIYSKFFINCPKEKLHKLLSNPNHFPFNFKQILDSCESVLNYLNSKFKKSGSFRKRKKSEKFGILDAPSLKEKDLIAVEYCIFGTSCLYLDIDNFKKLNTKYTNSVIDKTILPEFQKLINSTIDHKGFAYAEGGDEIVITLPNTNLESAIIFAKSLQALIKNNIFIIKNDKMKLAVSIGISYCTKEDDNTKLPERANIAMQHVKDKGKNGIAFLTDTGPKLINNYK